MHKIKVTDIQIIPIVPKDGLVGFASIVLNNLLYLSSIGIYSRLEGGFRLTYPTKKVEIKNINIFYPISKEFAAYLEISVTKKFEEVIKARLYANE